YRRLAGVALFLDLGCLAPQAAQVVELRTAYVAAAFHLDLVDDRAVQGKRALHADPEAHLADRKCFADAIACSGDHYPGKLLDSRPSALDDLDVHLDGVAWTEGGDIAAHRSLVELMDELAHDNSSPGPQAPPGGHPVEIASRSQHSPCGRCRIAGRQPSSLPHLRKEDEIGRAGGIGRAQCANDVSPGPFPRPQGGTLEGSPLGRPACV